MSLVDELQKLDELHRHSALTDAEFTRAKATLLANPNPLAKPVSNYRPAAPPTAERDVKVRYQNELKLIDREWEIERQRYMVTSHYGRQMVPTAGMALGTGGLFVVVGVIWTITAYTFISNLPIFGPFSIVKFVFPILGIVVIVAGIAWGAYCYTQARKYERAYREYQARRWDMTFE